MFFFKRKQPDPVIQAPVEVQEKWTRLGKTVIIKGTISGQDDIEIEGAFEGDIDIQGEVSIKQEGTLSGRIKGNRVLISGTAEGHFSASHKMELQPTARIKGEVSAPLLSIEAGATLNGKVTMASISTERQISQGPSR